MPPTAKAEFERLSMKHPEHFMVTISPRFRIRIICEKTTLLVFNFHYMPISSYLFDSPFSGECNFLNSSVKSLSSQHPQMETAPRTCSNPHIHRITLQAFSPAFMLAKHHVTTTGSSHEKSSFCRRKPKSAGSVGRVAVTGPNSRAGRGPPIRSSRH